MGVPYAEVIGDPIAYSKSPLIHKFWLEKLGIEGMGAQLFEEVEGSHFAILGLPLLPLLDYLRERGVLQS